MSRKHKHANRNVHQQALQPAERDQYDREQIKQAVILWAIEFDDRATYYTHKSQQRSLFAALDYQRYLEFSENAEFYAACSGNALSIADSIDTLSTADFNAFCETFSVWADEQNNAQIA